MGKFIFFDIDGTLLSHKSGIPASSKEAIHKARQNGHKLFIATGRPKSKITASIRDIGFDGYIYSSGAAIEVHNKIMYHQEMHAPFMMDLIAFLTHCEIGFTLEGHNYLYCDPIAETFWTELLESPTFAMDKSNFRSVRDYVPANSKIQTVSIFSQNSSQFKLLQEFLNDHPEIILLTYENTHDGMMFGELMLKGITKATGIKHLLAHYSKSIKDTISFGDSMNDMEMLAETNLGISMGNGSNALKLIADDVTDSVDQDGIYKAFVKYRLI